MVSSIDIEKLKKSSKEYRENKKNFTDKSKKQIAQTRLKSKYFVLLFQKLFKDKFDEEYELRPKHWNGNKRRQADSDHRRLSAVCWKLSIRQDNPLFWKNYIEYIFDLWNNSDIKHINNLIGFMENSGNIKNFFLRQNIAYRKDAPFKKSKNNIAGFSSKNKHEEDWNN